MEGRVFFPVEKGGSQAGAKPRTSTFQQVAIEWPRNGSYRQHREKSLLVLFFRKELLPLD
jgi:hypothetical protein